MIGTAAERGEMDWALVSVDSRHQRAHHHAAGMALDESSSRPWRQAPKPKRGRQERARAAGRTEPRTPGSSGAGSAGGTGPA